MPRATVGLEHGAAEQEERRGENRSAEPAFSSLGLRPSMGILDLHEAALNFVRLHLGAAAAHLAARRLASGRPIGAEPVNEPLLRDPPKWLAALLAS